MIKRLVLLTIVLSLNFAESAQEFRYGALLGTNAYDVEIDGPLIAESGISGLNVGLFGDYQINEKFGVKLNIIYTNTTETGYYFHAPGVYEQLFDEAELKTLQFHPMIKYDVNSDYNKGFHILAGFRFTNILSAKIEQQDASDFCKKSNFGALAGFGVTIARTVTLELVADYSLGSHLEYSGDKSKNVGAVFNLLVDVSSLINKGS